MSAHGVGMTEIAERSARNPTASSSVWSEVTRKEDWWAIWIGLGLIVVAVALFASGQSIKWIAVAPQKWSHLSDVAAQLRAHGVQYLALLVLWSVDRKSTRLNSSHLGIS